MAPLYEIGLRRTRQIWFVVLVLAMVGGMGATQLQWVTDVTALLPKADDGVLALSRRFGMMRTVAVVVRAEEPEDPRMHEALDRLGARIEGLNGIASVMARVDGDAAARSAQVMMGHAARLFDPEASLERRTVSARIDALKQKLGSPEAMLMGPYLLADPLGLSFDALAKLEAVGHAAGQVVSGGHLLSPDRRAGLVIATVDFDPMETDRSAAVADALDRALGEEMAGREGLTATALGGIHHAAITAAGMQGDVAVTFVLTLGLVVLIFFLFFRRIRLLPAAVLPAGVGIAVALGVFGLLGIRLHALTLAFAATITGISIDYVIHLLHHAAADPSPTSAGRMARALERAGRPVVLGCVTTVGAFGLIAFSGFVGVRQLALFSLVSLPTALFVVLAGLPGMHRFLLADAGRVPPAAAGLAALFLRSRALPRPWVWGATGVLLVGLGAAAAGVRLSGDPQDLGYRSEEIASRSTAVREAFGGIFDTVMLVSSGARVGQALERNDRLWEALQEAGIDADRIVSLSPFLPSPARQERAVAAVARAVERIGVSEMLIDAGFEADYVSTVLSGVDTPPITPEVYRDTSLWRLIENGLAEQEGETHVLTRVKGSDDETLGALGRVAQEVGARVISERLEIRRTLRRFQQELLWMLSIWLVAAVAVLAAFERSLFFGLRAALPALFGVLSAMAFFSATGRPLTPVASAGLTLVMGLGIDYGIFMQRGDHPGVTAAAVGVSALTTLAAFGVLAGSRVQAMADIGVIILVGLSGALAAALVAVPALVPVRGKQGEREA